MYGIDRHQLGADKTRIVVRRLSDPGKKFGNFIILCLTFGVSFFALFVALGLSLESASGYLNQFLDKKVYPHRAEEPLMLFAALCAIWPTVKVNKNIEKQRSESFVFTENTLTDEKQNTSYERKFLSADFELRIRQAYTAKTVSQADQKERGMRDLAEKRGYSVRIFNGAKKIYLIHGLSERQAAVFVDIINKWLEDPESIHYHNL
jgi:hypothetical protein